MPGRAALVTALALASGIAFAAAGEPPEGTIVEGPAGVPRAIMEGTKPFLEYRTARFQGWNPDSGATLIATRFGDTNQIHSVASPGGRREQLTFEREPIWAGAWSPGDDPVLLVGKDAGGRERFQFYRVDKGALQLLTRGEGRNTDLVFRRDGKRIGYSSTRRNGRDTDLWIMDPRAPVDDRLVVERTGSGWRFMDFASDGNGALVQEYVSSSESRLYHLDIETGELRALTRHDESAVYGPAKYGAGDTVYFMSDASSDFKRLFSMDLRSGRRMPVSEETGGDVEAFDVAHDGSFLVYVVNESGISRVHVVTEEGHADREVEGLPAGVVSDLQIAPWGETGFTLRFAQSPGDVYSFERSSLDVKRWTYSETGGVPHDQFVEPELVRTASFDGTEVSGFLYRPDPEQYRGPRPVIVMIHGGPAGQSRPVYLGQENYYLNELGIALFYPNVRGSTGYGKRFLTLDDGLLREGAVRDIGAFVEALAQDSRIDAERMGVSGGSYGGYLVLASILAYSERLEAGHVHSGISHFVNFLETTEEYRRDLRRAEYGDERDPAMREFLNRISPLSRAGDIARPLYIVSGANDPRVPLSESEQIVSRVRNSGGTAWHLIASDEGHGFRKKSNRDYHFWTTILFWQQFLLDRHTAD